METTKFRTYMIYFLFRIIVNTNTIQGIIVNNVSFDIEESACLTNEKFHCESICGKIEENVIKISMIPSNDEVTSCDFKRVSQYHQYPYPEKKWNKILYKISIKEDKITRDLVYIRLLTTEELNKQFEENAASEIPVVNTEDITRTENFIQQNLKYSENINRLINSPQFEQTVFIYEANNSYKLKGSRVITPHQEYPNIFDINLNLTACFFSSFKTDIEFIAGVKRIDVNTFHAWMELEERVKKFIKNMQDNMAASKETLTIVDLFAEKESSTILMKQIILDTRTIIFAIPRYTTVKPIENTNSWCTTVCAQNGWIFGSQLINCCDPKEYMEDEKNSRVTDLLHAIPNLTYHPLIVYVKSKNVELLFENGLVSNLKKNWHYFCNDYDYRKIKDRDEQVNILTEVKEEEKCKHPLMNTVVRRPGYKDSEGFVIDLQLVSKNNESKNYKRVANNDELEYNTENPKYNYGRKIFKNNTNLWYIMLGSSIFNENDMVTWKYEMFPITPSIRNEIMRILESFPLGSVTCAVSDNSKESVNMLYTKENVIKRFIESIGRVNEELKETYLQYLWDTRYVLPVPRLSHLNMTFVRHGSLSSCDVLPMWTQIYNKYWSAVLRMTRKISRAKKQVNVYEAHYQLMTFKNSGKGFSLYKTEKVEGMYFYRYMIKMLITRTAQIALVTINDIFLLMGEAETPFSNDDNNKFLKTYCKLNCMNYGYEELTVDDKIINHCCEVTKDFLKEVTGTRKPWSDSVIEHTRVLSFPPEYNY